MFRGNDAFASFSVSDLAAAREFYAGTLGLEVATTDDAMGFLELHLGGGGRVLVYDKPDHQPATFTVLNFVVDDVEQAVDRLAGAGIEMLRYEGFEQDARGIARSDYGPPIAWFADPAGNVIAVMQAA